MTMMLPAKKATELANDNMSSDVEYHLILIMGAIIHWAGEGDFEIRYELYGSDSVTSAVIKTLTALDYQVEITSSTEQRKCLEITWN